MTRFKAWTLTDVGSDSWLDHFAIDQHSFRLDTTHAWSIRKRTLRGGRRDGVDVVEVNNGDLSFTVLPTRGMGLWRGAYRGNYLGWQAPMLGPVHPKHVNVADRGGLGWLAGFDEWLCRCGLAFNGPPGDDVWTDSAGNEHRELLSLHGRIENIPAHYVEVRAHLDAPHELAVIGQVEEGSLFGGHLLLTTTYTTAPGSNRLVIHDVVENRAGQPAEIEMLYHCNFGPPFLEGGSRVLMPVQEMSPITPRAAEGIDTLDTYAAPTTGFAEQVYCYELIADASGRSLTMLYNRAADRAVVIRMNRNQLPCFTVWKNTQAIEDGYVTGLEPATNFPNIRTFDRLQGRVPTLPPCGKWEASWSIEILDATSKVAEVQAEIATLQAKTPAKIHRTPHPRFSAAAKQ